MKTITVLSGVLLLFTVPAFAELSGGDIEKIRLLFKEEISAVETRLTEKINTSEEHLKEYVTQEIEKVNIRIEEMDKRLTGKIEEMDKRLTGKIEEMDKRLTGEIDSMDKRLDQMFTLVVVLITAVIAVVGVPMTIILFQLSRQDKKQRSQDEIIEALRQALEERNQGSIITP